jgi:antirestriction protein
MRETTTVYLNTWGAYNNGSIGYGWMTATQAKEFIEENPERDGGEWFIADIDNYLGIQISSCDYCDVMEVLETIETLEDMEEWEQKEVIALMEYLNTENAQEAIDQKDNYTFYSDIEEYHDYCDECLGLENNDSILARYFDYEAYHRDCDFDIHEMSNGVFIAE